MLPRFLTISAAVLFMVAGTTASPSSEVGAIHLTTRALAAFEPKMALKRDNHEQDGDKEDVGDDSGEDSSGGSPEKRYTMADEKLVTPGSSDFGSVGSIRKRHGEKGSHRSEHEEEEKGEGEHGDIHHGKGSEHSREERGEGEHGDRPGREAKRNLKANRRLLAKRDIDSFVNKSGMFADLLIYKQGMINEKISGDKPKPASTLPNGHNGEASQATSRAKSLSSAAREGDVKALQNSH